ncbi:glycosyltransferase family 2 protein [Geodermatophilus sp. CPCC 206100]|uniref:glycosyltransferase family 2 protein n=1 Tax=Geodermatophilus sp. CPCC 206100 TaxID=3020054 RepID=UPI003AFFF393
MRLPAEDVTGTWCCELELSGNAPPRAVTPSSGQHEARVLVRLHGEPLGYLEAPLPAMGLDVDAVVRRAAAEFAPRIAAHLAEESLPVQERPAAAGEGCPNRVVSDELVTVVVCTRDRSPVLASCLEHLQQLTHPAVDVLVVDNAPSDESTHRLVAAVAARDPRVRYTREPRPGLSYARNRGLAEARGRYVLFTDDDVSVDPLWVQGVLKGFRRRDDVACVTGLVCTADISSAAEAYFDARAAAWSSRTEPRLYDLAEDRDPSALYPYSPGLFGTGANFAFDRDHLRALGGFDEALGAGTRTRGGEDIDVFVRVLRSGRALVYEPSAIVWHHHRADDAALLTQMYGYGTGLSAFVAKYLFASETRGEVLRRVLAGARRLVTIPTDAGERMGDQTARPDGARRRELFGVAVGPLLYLGALRDRRRRRAEDRAAA